MTDITDDVIEDAIAAELCTKEDDLYPRQWNELSKFAELQRQRERQAVAVPDGWKLVPIVATEEMLKAAYVDYESDQYTGPSSMYKAMLSAAPDCPHPIVEELTKE